jgi:hypothetical protein
MRKRGMQLVRETVDPLCGRATRIHANQQGAVPVSGRICAVSFLVIRRPQEGVQPVGDVPAEPRGDMRVPLDHGHAGLRPIT